MVGPLHDFAQDLRRGRFLALLPVSRILLERQFRIGSVSFYPPALFNVANLRVVSRFAFTHDPESSTRRFEGQELRELQTAATGIRPRHFESNVVVGTAVELDWDRFLTADHKYDLHLLHSIMQKIERVMDVVRFHCCRFDLPETLPGRVGTWNDSGGFCAALLYCLQDHESYVIAGNVVNGMKPSRNSFYQQHLRYL